MLSRSSRKRSRVWLHFSLNSESDEIAECNICRAKLSILGGNVHNLNRHLKSKHDVIASEDNQRTKPVKSKHDVIANEDNQRTKPVKSKHDVTANEDYRRTEPVTAAVNKNKNNTPTGKKCKQPPSEYSPDGLEKYDEMVDEELGDHPDYARNTAVRNIVRKIIARTEREKRTLEAQLKAEIEEKEKYKHDKEKLELISFCNMYRRQLDRFETLFSKREFFHLFPSFEDTVKMMLPILNDERKEQQLSMLVVGVPGLLSSLFQIYLTRIERWRIILLWFFMDQIAIVENTCIPSDEMENVKIIVETHLKPDFENLKNSSRCKPIFLLKERCLSSLQTGFKTDIHRFIEFELRGIAVALNEAYQRCQEEIKRFESLGATPEGHLTIGKSVTCSAEETEETEDDYTINLCLDLIVKLGRELASS